MRAESLIEARYASFSEFWSDRGRYFALSDIRLGIHSRLAADCVAEEQTILHPQLEILS